MEVTHMYKESPKERKRIGSGLDEIRVLVRKISESLECYEGSDRDPHCEDFCSHSEECYTVRRLNDLLSERMVFCYCHPGKDIDKSGHTEKCMLGERGRKVRRRLEDRLRKDTPLMLTVAKIVGIEEE